MAIGNSTPGSPGTIPGNVLPGSTDQQLVAGLVNAVAGESFGSSSPATLSQVLSSPASQARANSNGPVIVAGVGATSSFATQRSAVATLAAAVSIQSPAAGGLASGLGSVTAASSLAAVAASTQGKSPSASPTAAVSLTSPTGSALAQSRPTTLNLGIFLNIPIATSLSASSRPTQSGTAVFTALAAAAGFSDGVAATLTAGVVLTFPVGVSLGEAGLATPMGAVSQTPVQSSNAFALTPLASFAEGADIETPPSTSVGWSLAPTFTGAVVLNVAAGSSLSRSVVPGAGAGVAINAPSSSALSTSGNPQDILNIPVSSSTAMAASVAPGLVVPVAMQAMASLATANGPPGVVSVAQSITVVSANAFGVAPGGSESVSIDGTAAATAQLEAATPGLVIPADVEVPVVSIISAAGVPGVIAGIIVIVDAAAASAQFTAQSPSFNLGAEIDPSASVAITQASAPSMTGDASFTALAANAFSTSLVAGFAGGGAVGATAGSAVCGSPSVQITVTMVVGAAFAVAGGFDSTPGLVNTAVAISGPPGTAQARLLPLTLVVPSDFSAPPASTFVNAPAASSAVFAVITPSSALASATSLPAIPTVAPFVFGPAASTTVQASAPNYLSGVVVVPSPAIASARIVTPGLVVPTSVAAATSQVFSSGGSPTLISGDVFFAGASVLAVGLAPSIVTSANPVVASGFAQIVSPSPSAVIGNFLNPPAIQSQAVSPSPVANAGLSLIVASASAQGAAGGPMAGILINAPAATASSEVYVPELIVAAPGLIIPPSTYAIAQTPVPVQLSVIWAASPSAFATATTASFSSVRTPIPYLWNRDQQWWQVNQERQRETQALYAVGELCLFVLMWSIRDFERGDVQVCPTCNTNAAASTVYKQGSFDKCPTCQGVRYAGEHGGVKAKLVRPTIWQFDEQQTNWQNKGELQLQNGSVTTTADFRADKRDYIFRGDGKRYQILDVEAVHLATGFGTQSHTNSAISTTYPRVGLENPSSPAYEILPDVNGLIAMLNNPYTRQLPDYSSVEFMDGEVVY